MLIIYFQDKKNVMNLVSLYDIYNKKHINHDVLMMIYNYLASPNGNKRYKSILINMSYFIYTI